MPLRIFFLIGILALSSAVIAAEKDANVRQAHPIIGKWRWTNKENNCTETYNFKPDGTVSVISGNEKTDNAYRISANPDDNGFFELTIKVKKDYGGKDCADSEKNNTGEENTIYVLFEPSKEMHIACVTPQIDRCYGPLKRVER